MGEIKLICDSSCDLSIEYAKAHGIIIKPLQINIGIDKTFHDGVDITVDDLYKYVKEYNVLPKTSALSPKDYMDMFKKYTNEGYDVIYTGIGSGFSSSYQTGFLVSQEFNNVEIVDSQNLSTGIALVLFKALKWIKEGYNVHEVAQKMREIVPLVRSQFAIDTLDYLHKGGRCSAMIKLVGTFLKIKPVIQVRNNVMEVGAKPRGKVIVGIDKMLEMLEADKDNVDKELIFITHSKAYEYVTYTKEKIEKIIPNAKVIVTEAGAIVSTHCGPNTLGIFYLLEK